MTDGNFDQLTGLLGRQLLTSRRPHLRTHDSQSIKTAANVSPSTGNRPA
ncbi:MULTISPECIES: hypothetical protein [Streptomyces]|uniref:Uncharacterized protein n=1 Tax=Streptomyces glycanivorans TaxID=3033808 RepID=A0ABY9JBL9_9ACTN|nr:MULTISPECIES: hypothetical protein [unclassified Streptomyces]WLQ65193.1 hypothetical protein P8A20_17010 [Streptomyces sp. Alt3]WSQ78572.1 hypothetical protein OG725_16265 [Streptomyces sp. NBC_01213]WSR07958.1 hypothetical protein OG265_19055 [Streptomyces sp. NBC_01208]